MADNLTEAEAANELMRLAREIARHNRLYHAQDEPEVSDTEYDALVRRNAELEAAFPQLVRADSPSRSVGHEVTASPLSKVQHEVRMMSLDNAFAVAEVEEFVARVRRFLALADDAEVAMTAEDKIDGLSCSLRYEAGKLVRASWRLPRVGPIIAQRRLTTRLGWQANRLTPKEVVATVGSSLSEVRIFHGPKRRGFGLPGTVDRTFEGVHRSHWWLIATVK